MAPGVVHEVVETLFQHSIAVAWLALRASRSCTPMESFAEDERAQSQFVGVFSLVVVPATWPCAQSAILENVKREETSKVVAAAAAEISQYSNHAYLHASHQQKHETYLCCLCFHNLLLEHP